jgi:phosphoribosylformylglycinamidine synthase
MKPRAMILFAPGINRDHDVATALEMAGAETFIYPIKQLFEEKIDWAMFQMLVVPGGFSYADALGAGRLLALDLNSYFTDEVSRFLDAGKPAIGICNGFQALVKAGILPDRSKANEPHKATLTFNQSNHFECRWVNLAVESTRCVFTRGLEGKIMSVQVAHGEGKFFTDHGTLREIEYRGQVVFRYAGSEGSPTMLYPANPKGSLNAIAGICDSTGRIMGMMPHPERCVSKTQHPNWRRLNGDVSTCCQEIFRNAVEYARQM